MSVGLVSCSKLKLPVPAPAWLLYSRSPRFSQAFQYARSRSDVVYIVSAKFGLVEWDRVLKPYNLTLTDYTATEGTAWAKKIKKALGGRVVSVSVLGGEYRRLLEGVGLDLGAAVSGGFFAQAKALGKQGALRGNNEDGYKVCWPMEWILEFVYQNGQVRLYDLLQEIKRKYTHPSTIRCQLDRAVKCPVHVVEGSYIRNRYASQEG